MAGLIEYWLFRFALATISVFPSLARLYVKLFEIAAPRLRRAAEANLAIAKIPDRGTVDGVFDSVARILVSFAQFPRIGRGNIGRWIRYEGLDNFNRALAQGRGVLIATAHFGNWELSAFAHALMAAPMHVVVRPIDNPRIDRLVEQRRALSGNLIIEKKDAARDILRALKSGGSAGILIDQNSTLDQGIFIDFFGKKACTGSAFVKLAHHSGAPVILGYALWSAREKRYILTFEPEFELTGEVERDTQLIHSRLEALVREHPDQYLWLHRRWKTRPPGERPLY